MPVNCAAQKNCVGGPLVNTGVHNRVCRVSGIERGPTIAGTSFGEAREYPGSGKFIAHASKIGGENAVVIVRPQQTRKTNRNNRIGAAQ